MTAPTPLHPHQSLTSLSVTIHLHRGIPFPSAFLLGLGLRRRRIQAAQLLLAALLLIALTTLTACGGPPTLTPGTYTYTLTATPVDPTTTTTLSASANAVITVPPGIVTNTKPNP